ncbi:hypothetical protein L3Y34_016598 [Caenorhabditis briggsae]|uniref:C-type lectin domain-containing protein n=1 Tax=Caenorhabditis briggsae TaxID=6238 RepID=A0AAE9J1D1_CAEBR|nr:hypothetical protein L3Y34_016598 [Caenorhabditis briggsae]
MKLSILIFFSFLCPILAAIGVYNGGEDSSSSSSWSSESHEGRGGGRGGRGGHGHGNGGGRPRPQRPPARPRPPREKTNCPADWMLFKRSQGNWCVKVFVGRLNQPQAEAQCVVQGAVLSGLETDEERVKVAEMATKLVHQNGFDQASVWIGAKRKAACPRVNVCPAKDTFEWTDGQTTGTDGFGWSLGQPDGVWSNVWGHQSCCHQFVFASGSTSPTWPGIFHGQLDDQHCLEQWNGSNNKMYACGKLAT